LGHLPGFTTKRLSNTIRNKKRFFNLNTVKKETTSNQRFNPTNSRPQQPNDRNSKGKKRLRQKPILTPGQHGKKPYFFLKSRTPYGLRLLEKQKLRFNYHLSEKQLVRYVNQAKTKSQSTGLMLLRLLEMRLDNIVYRLGMAPTIVAARQLVNHGHILVNQNKVTIPSYGCQAKDQISITSRPDCRKLIDNRLANQPLKWRPPRHLQLNRKSLVAVVKKAASRKVVQLRINELLVIEYYSGK
jgi:small subunit ribosomal protein S4